MTAAGTWMAFYVGDYVKNRQKPCRHCGDARSERHHPDYARPLFVIWLCRPCHLKLHAAKRRRQR